MLACVKVRRCICLPVRSFLAHMCLFPGPPVTVPVICVAFHCGNHYILLLCPPDPSAIHPVLRFSGYYFIFPLCINEEIQHRRLHLLSREGPELPSAKCEGWGWRGRFSGQQVEFWSPKNWYWVLCSVFAFHSSALSCFFSCVPRGAHECPQSPNPCSCPWALNFGFG